LGALREGEVVDLRALAEDRGDTLPEDLLGLIELGEDGLRLVRALLARVQDARLPDGILRPVDQVEVLAPLDPPRGNVVAIGRNYAEHARESARARGEEVTRPTVFTKALTSINGPYGNVTIDPAVTTQVDWEAELGVVIGRRGVNIARDRWRDHVFGYTVVNDVSARDIQFGWGGQFFKGKSLDGFCPIGPWIVTADEIDDPQNLHISCRINGETKQDASTADMIFPVDQLVSDLSLGMTLLPGTLVATGTPEGVGFARSPQEFLQPGDVMETEIEGIGLLRNRIVRR
jgi:2-keto-4-pentenoate hydratase/2-oxohepta-3-ene-1,7-dioic acid hydratase in catechol pathway